MTASDDVMEVRLLRVPVALRQRSTQHGEELLREMELIAAGQSTGVATDVPQRLLDMVSEMRGMYGPQIAAADEQFHAAEESGQTAFDLTYQISRDATVFLRRLDQVLKETDEFCRAGRHLLTLAVPPEIAAYRRWSFDEILRQLDGHPPTPWPGVTPTGEP